MYASGIEVYNIEKQNIKSIRKQKFKTIKRVTVSSKHTKHQQ